MNAELDKQTKKSRAIETCEKALKASVPNIYLRTNFDHIPFADFALLGRPENLFVSVNAKERLQQAVRGDIKPNFSPTIAWEPFITKEELNLHRVYTMKDQSFLKMYIPDKLYDKASEDITARVNSNRKAFVRPLSKITEDLANAIEGEMIDIYKI